MRKVLEEYTHAPPPYSTYYVRHRDRYLQLRSMLFRRSHRSPRRTAWCLSGQARNLRALGGGADGAEADVGPDDLAVEGGEAVSQSLHRHALLLPRSGREREGKTYALGMLASTSLGVPELWAQSPRSPPGVPAFSGGYEESSQSMLA